MEKKPLKVLSKNGFMIVHCFIALFLLVDTLFGLRFIVKLQTVWYESSSGSPQNFYFALYGAGEKLLAIIPLQYLGKLERQKDFIHFIMKRQPSIRLDRNCERLLDR